MVRLNPNFELFDGQPYLFADIGTRTVEYQAKNPKAKIIKLGIGDTTRPIHPWVNRYNVEAAKRQQCAKGFTTRELKVKTAELAMVRRELQKAGFDKICGYPPGTGDLILRERLNWIKYNGRFELD